MAILPSPLSKPQRGQPCPCGSGQLFEACCEPILTRQRSAATAEQLMRSRFTAHVAGDEAHLHRTYQETARLPYVAEPAGGPGPAWTRLVVHAHETGARPDIAFVEFSAFYNEGDAEHALEEKAEFRRLNGEWIYTRAVRQGPAPVKAQAKPGRNDPCPCGSGKKYKQCCLLKSA